VQARFALATMYDRAANEENPKKEPGAAVPKSMSPQDQTSASPDQGAAPTSPPPGNDAGTTGTPKP